MTLADINLPITDQWGKAHALIFSPSLALRLQELHKIYGSPNLMPTPLPLQDGRLMLCADILTEVSKGGLLQNMWEAADKNLLLPNVEIIPWDEAILMIKLDIDQY